MSLDIAMAQAALGRRVFPVKDKKPLVRWTAEATTNPKRLRAWWKVWPDAGVGWALPPEVAVIDIDDVDAFMESDVDLPPTLGQKTTRGFHMLYEYEDLEIKQGPFPGGDVKAGGKGYVKLYSEDAFTKIMEFTDE